MGEMPILPRMLFYADCGAKLYQVWHRGWTYDKELFMCAIYRKVKGDYNSQQIKDVVVEELLLDGIQNIIAFARDHEDEFVQLVMNSSLLRDDRRELE